MKVTRNLGMLLLGIWLVATGLLALLGISIPGAGPVLNLLAVAAGLVILLRR